MFRMTKIGPQTQFTSQNSSLYCVTKSKFKIISVDFEGESACSHENLPCFHVADLKKRIQCTGMCLKLQTLKSALKESISGNFGVPKSTDIILNVLLLTQYRLEGAF